MNRCYRRNFRTAGLALSLWTVLWIALAGQCLANSQSTDERLEAAREYVLAGDRYLHQDQLHRGMKGYGLTVMAGTEIVRFDVEILSVMTRWGPHQDVILAKLSKQNLEKTGLISGMSGSPCYIIHEGKPRLIGAVAYGWMAQKEALCGIQPITQMLAAAQWYRPETSEASEGHATYRRSGQGLSERDFSILLDPAKRDFSQLMIPDPPNAADGAPRLAPLLTPLSVSGLGSKSIGRIADMVRPLGMIPVQTGGVGVAETRASDEAAFTPGAAISVPLVTGDLDFSAVGTVTDVVGDRVIAFGHSFFAEGETAMPMGPGYIHAVLPSILVSVKLGSTLKITGTIDRDEAVGISGRVGPKPDMIPMDVQVRWFGEPGEDEDGYVQDYSYQLVRHRRWTPLLASLITASGVWEWRDPPELHTVRHEVEIDFGELGRYRTSNVSSGASIMAAMSDISRPLVAMLNNSLGEAPDVKRITVKIQILRGSQAAIIRQLKLDGRIYRPGETVTGKVTIRPFRKQRLELPISFVLPDDLEDGRYRLTACDSVTAGSSLRREMPHKYDPKTVEQLLASIQRVVELKANRLYLRFPIKREGLAIGPEELPDLPEFKRAILSEAVKLDTHSYTRSIVRSTESDYVLRGSADAELEIQTKPTETLIHQSKRKPE